MHCNTEAWAWAIRAEKLARLCQLLLAAIDIDRTTFDSKDMRSLAGLLIHIKPVILASRFIIEKIMAVFAAAGKADSVVISPAYRGAIFRVSWPVESIPWS